eukprot:CAMPEP_0176394510 /NCGR_PEP_ID=MMETSP0126-20121128/42627_1 /TAXON_ID=141414 ORGANISM="Strombidinopsis acuminatum, Strain SPMC142" /NCGR_SAMPLE_ID=MMETSP0126 /ASSEMBLY_ACC=CAM_ASM_000229 /LENGTH=121 /DNA_ID=CAMNT_0017766753 /DNA_START=1121 /DNA_END=1486 /DNA_ORIENTATION=-
MVHQGIKEMKDHTIIVDKLRGITNQVKDIEEVKEADHAPKIHEDQDAELIKETKGILSQLDQEIIEEVEGITHQRHQNHLAPHLVPDQAAHHNQALFHQTVLIAGSLLASKQLKLETNVFY